MASNDKYVNYLLGERTHLLTYSLTHHRLLYLRTPWRSGCCFEKSMPPMTRPATMPPMCMKLSTKGVRPMSTWGKCTGAWALGHGHWGMCTGAWAWGMGMGHVHVHVRGTCYQLPLRCNYVLPLLTLISVEKRRENTFAPLSVPRAQKLRITSAQHAPVVGSWS